MSEFNAKAGAEYRSEMERLAVGLEVLGEEPNELYGIVAVLLVMLARRDERIAALEQRLDDIEHDLACERNTVGRGGE